MKKKDILKNFKLSLAQQADLEKYINLLKNYNSHTNIVGKSSLSDPWNNHILDSLQITSFIKNKNDTIIDLGSGAGLPGVVLCLAGHKRITLLDSNGKKINFLKTVKKEVSLNFKIVSDRIENHKGAKYDIITSRALAKLSKLISYSQKLIKKNTLLIFLKGKTVNEEINEAQEKWMFQYSKFQSLSDRRGRILILKNIKQK